MDDEAEDECWVGRGVAGILAVLYCYLALTWLGLEGLSVFSEGRYPSIQRNEVGGCGWTGVCVYAVRECVHPSIYPSISSLR